MIPASPNGRVLRWARQTAGYSLEEIAAAFDKDPAEIKSWEDEERAPTYVQLERLAYSYYKRPIAVFFFPEPPEEHEATQEFRTIPGDEIEQLSADSRYTIRLAQSMQLALYELGGERNPADHLIFNDISAEPSSSPSAFAANVRQYLRISLDQQKRWPTADEAFKHWRNRLQDVGIFIFKRSLKQRDISGFCLIDTQYPVIYVNNSTPPTRQIFTIFHELGHILLHTSGITKRDDRYIRNLQGWAKDVEVFCNEFAAEFLVPTDDFTQAIGDGSYTDRNVSRLATEYSVSREVILRKMLDRGIVTQQYYEERAEKWNHEYLKAQERKREREGGGNYYATHAQYLGDRFIRLAFSRYYQGTIGTEQLAEYLNTKPKNLRRLEAQVLPSG